jgi:hypothetical protein
MFFISFFPPEWYNMMFGFFFSLIFINAALVVKKRRKHVVAIALFIVALELLSSLLEMRLLNWTSKIINIIFFVFIVFNFITMIARSKTVTANVILESINGYLMLGLVFALMIAIAMLYDPNSFHFPQPIVEPGGGYNFYNYIYYGMVTLSTLGYGDIVPLLPFSKSLATLTSIAGQLYIAIIIAMLVGKYSAKISSKNK